MVGTGGVGGALARVREAPFVVDALRAADDLAAAAGAEGGTRAARLLVGAVRDGERPGGDELVAIAAVHALGRTLDDAADAELSALLSSPRAYLREHAAWALGSRLPRLDAIGRLVAVVAAGGFSGMLAQRTLQQWARSAADHVALAVEGALAASDDVPARTRLAETLGLIHGPVSGRALRQVAADPDEALDVRQAAVAALGDRGTRADPDDLALVTALTRQDGDLGAVARLALLDLTGASARGPLGPRGAGAPAAGLTVAQVFLHADVDRALTRAGAGDTGGVATLLVRLGDALAARPEIGRVLTVSRGTPGAALDALADVAVLEEGHLLAPVPLLRAPSPAAQAWPARVAAERAVRRILERGGVDVLHLRMADVGSLAASTVAAQLGVPVVFTLAPDPHAVIHALDMTGALTRANLGRVDELEHYWFRARLVQRLAADAAHTVLFPRAELRHDVRELLGLDIDVEPSRFTVVPEGIDTALSRQAAAEVVPATGPEFDDLRALLGGLPEHRRGLPLVLSVGRLHRVKGMVTLVAAWASDERLRAACNLLVVGGDLADPSPDERGQLDLVERVLTEHPHARDGLLLAGHRPNGVVVRWLAAAHTGIAAPSGAVLAAPGGVYACASLKEEFGLALLEALAAGLPVVAPAAGGPATYVEDGVTGVLVDTSAPAAVAAGLRRALDLAGDDDGRPRRAAALVEERFTVQAMAQALAGVYAGVVEPAAS